MACKICQILYAYANRGVNPGSWGLRPPRFWAEGVVGGREIYHMMYPCLLVDIMHKLSSDIKIPTVKIANMVTMYFCHAFLCKMGER